jgi:hypothetical protein
VGLYVRSRVRPPPGRVREPDKYDGPLLAGDAGRVVRRARQAGVESARLDFRACLDAALRADGRVGLAGLAAGGVRRSRRCSQLFIVQLVFNVLWTHLFFGQHRLDLALLEIVTLWGAILATGILFWGVNRVAGALLVPYLAWVSFATYLNFALWSLNRSSS